MDVLAQIDGTVYVRVGVTRAEGFAPPFSGESFPCLIWDHEGTFSADARSVVAQRLIEAGCRYAVCGGESCEAWHDAVDDVFLEAHVTELEEASDASFVMTTWHAGETPEEVAFFFVRAARFENHEFRRYLVLHVGHGPAEAAVDAAVRKHAFEGRAF